MVNQLLFILNQNARIPKLTIFQTKTERVEWIAREKMGYQAVDANLDTLSGKKPENLVNEEVWENES